MIRRTMALLITLTLGFLVAPLAAKAQQTTTILKIGFLGGRPASSTGLETLRRNLRALGYVEGQHIAFEARYADDEPDRLPGLAAELVHLNVDVLVMAGTNEVRAAKHATRTIPIVFANVADPVADGLVDSLARPGGNITGFSPLMAVLAGKRLEFLQELLKDTVPKLSRVAVLWDPRNVSSTQQWQERQLAARNLGLQLHSVAVSRADQYEDAFHEAMKAGSAALAVTLHGLANSHQQRIVDLATNSRLPAIYARRDFVESGGLMSYGHDNAEPYRRVASMVDKILKGTKPADLPVEQPTKFELVLNLKTAQALGLAIPPTLLFQADEIIR
jgi:putative tryptophan/tyrosine transport system substrate-binding protein